MARESERRHRRSHSSLAGREGVGVELSGDSGRSGGVPKRGGLRPNEFRSADDRADSPGPGSDDCGLSLAARKRRF